MAGGFNGGLNRWKSLGAPLHPEAMNDLLRRRIGTSDAVDETTFSIDGTNLTTGKAVSVHTLGSLTTGYGLEVAGATTALTGAGRLLLVDATGDFNDATGIVAEIQTVHTTGIGLQLTMDAITDGFGVDGTFDGLTTGNGMRLTSSATAITGAGRLLLIDHTGTTSTSGIVAEIKTDATDETVPLQVTTAGTGPAIQLEGGPLTEDQETVTTGSPTLQAWGSTSIDSSGGAVTGTLPDPSGGTAKVGQLKTIVMTEASNSSTITITSHETNDAEVATFDAVDEYGLFIWTGTEWATVAATCTFV